MSEHNPPAFPSGDKAAFPTATFEAGMTLRDWFAGQVLASASALPLGPGDYRFRANLAYEQADAMLAVRDALTNSEGGGE